ncbi:SPOR domain-containing protein [Cohnella caldifontis]|uniref:SPOR domain-containing protein n=1 Tax=Cohnella caldifontis TaxID=3027471 RepID=UPI0023EC6E8A|nr:SPOR domain-containing protein [Cohnella sp. YIM B05605]
MQPKARMTFRFDPPAKPAPKTAESVPSERREPEPIRTKLAIQEKEPAGLASADPGPAPQETASPGPVFPSSRNNHQDGGLLLDDPFTLEELIRNSGPVPEKPSVRPSPNASKSSREAHPPQPESEPGPLYEPELVGWDLPGDSPSGGKITYAKGSQTNGPSWWRAFVTVTGAVATGALFGYLVLTLFTGESVLPDKPGSTAAPAQATAGSGAAPSGTATAVPNGKSGGVNVETELPGETYYLLQYGVFRTEESLDAALEELKKKGFPAVADRSDGYRAFAGAAATKEEADRLAEQMPSVQVFVKEVTAAPLEMGGEASERLAPYVRLSHELAKKLADLSVGALQDPMPQPIGEEELASLRETFRQWTAASAAAKGLPDSVRDAAGEMARSLNAAMVSVDDYGRNVSRFHLWRVQADVVDVVLADRALRSAWAPAEGN